LQSPRAELFVDAQFEDGFLFRRQPFDHAAELFLLFLLLHERGRRTDAAGVLIHLNEFCVLLTWLMQWLIAIL
jgi:hypothetical protein